MANINTQYTAAVKHLEKAQKSVNRYATICEKKLAKCEKLDCIWTDAEWYRRRDTNNYTGEQFTAWFEWDIAKDNLHEAERKHNEIVKRVKLLKACGAVELEDEEKAEETYAPATIAKPEAKKETTPTGDRKYKVSFIEKANCTEYKREMTVTAGNAKEACKIAKEQFNKQTGKNAFRPTAKRI